MTRNRKKEYYAVFRGRIAPAICASWGVADALVNGYEGNEHKGFYTLSEASSFMENKGYPSYKFFCGSVKGERAPGEGEPVYYAVANGKNVGVYECYQGGTKEEITEYPHSCHKVFGSREEAEDFIKEYRITTNLVEGGSVGEDICTVLSDRLRQIALDRTVFI